MTPGPPPTYVAWGSASHEPVPRFHALFTDTSIPEFTDAFPDSMPFLYVRAAGGNTANVSISGAPNQTGGASSGNDHAVWNPAQLAPYAFPASADATGAQIPGDAYTGAIDPDVKSDFASPHYYFTQGADHLTPRQRSQYLLIAAGKDRKYMTHDDRINGSPAQ